MIFKFIFKKRQKGIKEKLEKKIDMNRWMNLTKEERLEIDLKDKNEIMRKKRSLLKSIREEYIKIKKQGR